MSVINSILITRDPGSYEQLEQWCSAHQIRLKQTAFIKTESALNVVIPQTDWIFFSSPQGAKQYLKHYSIKAKKIAVFGQGTGAILSKAGFNLTFIGKATDVPEIIGQKFNDLLSDQSTVFFPISDRSKRTVIEQINAAQLEVRITYRTIDQQQKIQESFDVILFTSPSNFLSFIKSNDIGTNSRLIAMGNTTRKAMLDFKPDLSVSVLKTPTVSGIISFLEEQL